MKVAVEYQDLRRMAIEPVGHRHARCRFCGLSWDQSGRERHMYWCQVKPLSGAADVITEEDSGCA